MLNWLIHSLNWFWTQFKYKLLYWNGKSSSKGRVWFVGKRCSLHTPTMNYSDAELAESIDSRSSNLNLQPRKGRFFFFFSWRAQISLSSPPVSTVSPQQINTTNTFTALVVGWTHKQLPTIMSQHWRKFTTQEHLSKLSGNKAGVVLPHEICLVIRHKCMCVLYFIFRQVVHGSESGPLPWYDSRSDSLSGFALSTIKLHFRCLDGICNLCKLS